MPHALFVGPDSEFENLEDFVSYAKDHPGELTVGESGALGLLMVLAFNDIAGIETTPVAYEGGGDLINALLGGHVNGASSSITAEQELNPQGGKALAYAAEERIEMFSDTPTFSEQGFDLQLGVSRVLVAPEGVPDEVVKVLTEALNELGQGDEIKQKFDEVGTPYRYLNHEDVTEYLKKSNETILPIIEKNADDF
ncbi:tricarboxylate transport protein TctC [Gracilibacillus boraciitolerans JCM 21714]|uniref:Tricarboxylate transport protein TctC n=1 Tax=Gracilibacillus boraciitolerans JCM 21714 TaxID=1298598 RepID=W4VJ09_9BACI|nr:tricarboxylate transport protein TctC [Gracilibacillus boraciitolerans JCM 21714]